MSTKTNSVHVVVDNTAIAPLAAIPAWGHLIGLVRTSDWGPFW